MVPHYIKCCGDVWLDFTATTSCVGLQGEFPTRNRPLHYSEYHVQLICGNIFVIWFRSSQTKDLEGLSQISFPTTPVMFHILQPIFYQFCVYRRRYYLLFIFIFYFCTYGCANFTTASYDVYGNNVLAHEFTMRVHVFVVHVSM